MNWVGRCSALQWAIYLHRGSFLHESLINAWLSNCIRQENKYSGQRKGFGTRFLRSRKIVAKYLCFWGGRFLPTTSVGVYDE
jgi:hypothetical protein